ncbi:MAG TPA: helix-turn-helix domain-containing protein [Thermomicrobiales bacterium]|nr:helix-turn-helix domain-containing protein [Thermomicrobiales bacterium]
MRRYRTRAGLSQADLAERAGLTISAISVIERGVRTRPYAYTTRQLADALGLDGDERAAFLATRDTAARKHPTEPAAEPATPGPTASTSIPPTPLIGRALELASLRARIDRPATGRLTTITGLAGIGKTRVALQLAVELGPAFPDGVWFVALAPVSDPAEVPRAVAAKLGVREAPEEPLVERLIAFLAPRRALLILDNCEHVHETCAALLGRLLASCPDLQDRRDEPRAVEHRWRARLAAWAAGGASGGRRGERGAACGDRGGAALRRTGAGRYRALRIDRRERTRRR